MYAHYTEHFGMTPQEAAAKIMESNTPEYKAQLPTRLDGKDIPKIMRENLKIGDLQSEFKDTWGPAWLVKGPTVGVNHKAQQEAFTDYAELFRDNYLETGDVAIAKAQAIAQLGKIWGVSRFTGTYGGVLMRYPPEQAPAHAGIPNVADRIAAQAIEAIKAEMAPAGPQLTRDKLVFMPTDGGQTAQAYMSGQPVPYWLGWKDKNDITHILNPGRAFVFDGAAERAKISEEQRTGLAAGAARADADAAYRERAFGLPQGAPRPQELQAAPERHSEVMSDEDPRIVKRWDMPAH